jgi:endonuclease/exonuclease/phosphatase family metal-dependent hydrolase
LTEWKERIIVEKDHFMEIQMKTLLGIIKFLLILVGIAVAGFGALLLWLSVREYRPGAEDLLTIRGGAEAQAVRAGEPIRFIGWNLGYGALSETEDFFMDGGKRTRPSSAALIRENIAGMRKFLEEAEADVILLQEVDADSFRSYHVDEAAYLSQLAGFSAAFAYNFLCPFVPIPLPPIGKVGSGLLTLSSFTATAASRVSLPIPFKWPVRIANLKRCLLVERLPVADSSRELVLVNLHLEAYDRSGGREAQTRTLMNLMEAEYARGNYVIAGGDFNQTFPGVDMGLYPVIYTEHFIPGELSPALLPIGWRYVFDGTVPTSRLLNEPYSGDPASTQLYVIDGFIISPNVEFHWVQTVDAGFRYTDHNPVRVELSLKDIAPQP